MQWIPAASPEATAALRALESRRTRASEDALRVADEAIAGVRITGDRYVAAQVERFDRQSIDPSELVVVPQDLAIAPELARSLDLAIERVDGFHRAQLPQSYRWKRGDTDVLHRVDPLRRVGIYAPGGRAVYVSTVLMCAIPARIAGVGEIVVATPPAAAARPELHYVCRRLGIGAIYRSGGAAAIAAMALGTASLPRVDKIVGPGNAYVTAAKARLTGEVGIDMTAGPTELVVIADDAADPGLIQADLDAQQEHGPDSAVICIWVGAPRTVRATLNLVAATIDEALEAAAAIAPEHLSIQTRDAAAVATRARNAGAIYCGPFSAPAAGDYAIGSNHVLPTAGSARFFSPLGVYDFVRRTNVITIGEATISEIGPAAARIAELEGLPAHARSIECRTSVASERKGGAR
jgi:histidinol dehydrogenase